MPDKPKRNKQIQLDFKVYHKSEQEAIENDKSVKKVAEKYLKDDKEEAGSKLEQKNQELKKEVEKLKQENRELKKEIDGKNNWQSVDIKSFENTLIEMKGVGEHIAREVAVSLIAMDWWKIQFNEDLYNKFRE